MIEYSLSARRAMARLYRPYNDFDVYVEDSTLVGVYERIINRVLKGNGRVSKVVPLGPRNNVIDAAKAAAGPQNRIELYIVDSDLDLLARWRNERIPNLHRLKTYSLENLVMENHALEKFVCHAIPSKNREIALASVNVPALLTEIDQRLGMYFVALATARRMKLKGAIFKFLPQEVSYPNGGAITGPCPSKTRQRTKAVVSAIIAQKGKPAYDKAKSDVKSILRRRKAHLPDLLPAKQFNLTYVRHRISKNGGGSMSSAAATSYLADHCTLSKDRALKAKIRSIGRSLKI